MTVLNPKYPRLSSGDTKIHYLFNWVFCNYGCCFTKSTFDLIGAVLAVLFFKSLTVNLLSLCEIFWYKVCVY